MATTKYKLDELAQLGSEAYERKVRPNLGPEHNGKYVGVNVDTGDCEVDENDLSAIQRLRTRLPNAEIWLMQAGYPTSVGSEPLNDAWRPRQGSLRN